jgi:glycosyltransferase involved in cell wall biosynthesis
LTTIHVIAGLGAQHGGPSYSVPSLARALSAHGCGSDIYSVAEASGAPTDGDALVFPQAWSSTPFLSRLRLSPALGSALVRRVHEVDIIHNHGLWLMPNVVAGRTAAQARIPLIVSPRGMLAPEALQFSKRKKQLFWALFQKRALAHAAAWHATSTEEAHDIRAFGVKAPIAIIPNGTDFAKIMADHDSNRVQRTTLFLSRIHPKKGLRDLISAWSRVAAERPSWQLIIAGPDENGHRGELEELVARDSVRSVRFLDAVYGEDKAKLMASADLFVLPTKNENFGLVVAEALAVGVPAIVSKGAPWSGLEVERCGWWIDQGVEPLTAALLQATALAAAVRRDMGLRGSDWMARDFGWDGIAARMSEVYAWCLGKSDRPSTVVTV